MRWVILQGMQRNIMLLLFQNRGFAPYIQIQIASGYSSSIQAIFADYQLKKRKGGTIRQQLWKQQQANGFIV